MVRHDRAEIPIAPGNLATMARLLVLGNRLARAQQDVQDKLSIMVRTVPGSKLARLILRDIGQVMVQLQKVYIRVQPKTVSCKMEILIMLLVPHKLFKPLLVQYKQIVLLLITAAHLEEEQTIVQVNILHLIPALPTVVELILQGVDSLAEAEAREATAAVVAEAEDNRLHYR